MSFGNLLIWGLPRQYFSNLDALAALADLALLSPPRRAWIPPLFRCKSMDHADVASHQVPLGVAAADYAGDTTPEALSGLEPSNMFEEVPPF